MSEHEPCYHSFVDPDCNSCLRGHISRGAKYVEALRQMLVDAGEGGSLAAWEAEHFGGNAQPLPEPAVPDPVAHTCCGCSCSNCDPTHNALGGNHEDGCFDRLVDAKAPNPGEYITIYWSDEEGDQSAEGYFVGYVPDYDSVYAELDWGFGVDTTAEGFRIERSAPTMCPSCFAIRRDDMPGNPLVPDCSNEWHSKTPLDEHWSA